jgi:hypothetical protein
MTAKKTITGRLMTQKEKILQKLLSGTSDAHIGFDELCGVLRNLAFSERVRGSHFIYTKDGVEEILNIQSKGGKAKPYQVRQVRNVIVKYKLGGKIHD